MIRIRSLALIAALAGAGAHAEAQEEARSEGQDEMTYSLVIHGGAGTITRDSMSEAMETAYAQKLTQALEAGQAVLAAGGPALEAVTRAILIMEDSPLFNAGKGAVYTKEGRNELDAAIMDGKSLNAGAVAGVTRVRNPILLARAVMEKSRHVMLAREGAEEFARAQGIDLVSPLYFYTDRRFKQILDMQREGQEDALLLDHDATHKYGTVGAVARDAQGDIAAATSTGGLTNKEWGRIGDSPIIGAGTYADNESCGVSGTGTGEYFIRLTLARDICALMDYAGMSLQEAADTMVQDKLAALGGDGGVIAVGKSGETAFSFNTEGMYRGVVTSANPAPKIGIYKQ